MIKKDINLRRAKCCANCKHFLWSNPKKPCSLHKIAVTMTDVCDDIEQVGESE